MYGNCPNCGRRNDGTNFCPECGYDLRQINSQARQETVRDTIGGAKRKTEIGSESMFTVSAGGTLTRCTSKSVGVVVIPNGVKSIGALAFSGCKNLTSVTIPSTVTRIEGEAFSYCDSLGAIEIPEGVTEIGYAAFEDCASLTQVNIPRSVKSIGASAFCNCKRLTKITIPRSVTFIGEHAFKGCSDLFIRCEAARCPATWHPAWNPFDCPVKWNFVKQ